MSDRRTPLHEAHTDAGARMTEFGGWQMPVSFDSITAEHGAVRSAVGKFDVSHMGEIEVTGPDATALMQRLTTNDVEALAVGGAQYAAITDEAGIILDDTIVLRLADDGAGRYLFVPNAGQDEPMAERWRSHRDRWGLEAEIDNRTTTLGMIALQGPSAESLLDPLAGAELATLSRFAVVETTVAGVDCLVSRTGYTGEDGFELLVDTDETATLWAALDCQPCGLGARDTLRLEAGLLLGGNEFDAEANPRTPLEAGIGFAVALSTEFVGRDALAAVAEDGPDERLVGIGMVDRGIPRTGYPILDEGDEIIGAVTSGTMSPTLERPIGLGYVRTEHAPVDSPVRVRIRDAPKRAKIESLPFVD